MKPTTTAGWLVFVPMLFMSVFYLTTASFLDGNNGISALVCTGVCIAAAFLGTRIAASAVWTHKSEKNARKFLMPRLYMPFVIWISLAAALLAVLLNIITSYITKTSAWGLTGFYPMLKDNMNAYPALVFILFVIIPSILEELLLRGIVFPMCESQGTAAAVYYSALTTAMMFVYPQAVMAGLIIGTVAAIACHVTQSLSAAVAVHFTCRMMLWLCDAVLRSSTQDHSAIWTAIVLFLFFICIYRTLHTFEALLKSDLVGSYKPGAKDATENLKNLTFNTGFGLFVLIFVVRFIAMIVTYS